MTIGLGSWRDFRQHRFHWMIALPFLRETTVQRHREG
jgi:hypothetical protein